MTTPPFALMTDAPESPPPSDVLPQASPGPEARRAPSYPLFFGVAFATAALDLATKAWATKTFGGDDSPSHISVIRDHLNLTLSHNTGAAWGLLHDAPAMVRMPFFITVSLAAIVVVTLLYRKASPEQRALRWGLPLVLGGALGNLVDRVRLTHVVDFIQVFASWGGQEHYWPTFNVADIAIVVGVGLLLVDALTQGRRAQPVRA